MKIYLRPINIDDGGLIVKWRNDKQVLSHCMKKKEITIESNKIFFETNIENNKYIQFIVERIDDEIDVVSYPISTVYLKDMDYENHHCELCIFTSNDVEWMPESQAIAIKLLVEKAFIEFEMHKIYSYVFSKYPEELDLLKSAGFTCEAILKDEVLSIEGKYEDVARLCIINKQ